MSAYSAVSFGHAHPRIIAALVARRSRSASRRARIQRRAAPSARAARAAHRHGSRAARQRRRRGGRDALKAARKWAHKIKGVPTASAEIIACRGNFHGRTITACGLSTEPQYRTASGRSPRALHGSVRRRARARARDHARTAAFLVEPIQGEGGIIVRRRLSARMRAICRERRVLMICDEIQTGLGAPAACSRASTTASSPTA
jgi:ornithine--oxo-acid transaminase